MAMNLTLYMDTEASAGELLAECQRALHAFPLREQKPQLGEASVDAARKGVLNEAYNLSANAGLSFRLDTYGDVDAQMHALLGASLRVLDRYSGDAALIFNGDVAYFLRRAGTLVLNARDGMWGTERLSLVQGTFVSEDLPDL
jgi:hypothetical protein